MTSPSTVLETPDLVLEFTLGDDRYCVGIGIVDEIVGRVGKSSRIVWAVADTKS